MNTRERLARVRLARRGLLPYVERFARERGELAGELLDGTKRHTVTRVRRELWSIVAGSLVVGPSAIGHWFAVHHSTVTVALRARGVELAQEHAR